MPITSALMADEASMERVLVVGAGGMLGGDLCEVLKAEYECMGTDLVDFDITDPAATRENIVRLRPHVVVLLAAFTQVDHCEASKERAFQVNAEGAKHVALACRAVGARCVYLSTDYVFDGTKRTPYREDDPPNPLSVYGLSKLQGERYVQEAAPHCLIVRSAWLFSERGKNFVKTVISLARERQELEMVHDQTGSPTYTKDLSRALVALIASRKEGIFHVANTGSCTWFEFAQRIVGLIGSSLRLIPVSTAQCGRAAARPAYSVLGNEKIHSVMALKMPPWEEALSRCIKGLRTAGFC